MARIILSLGGQVMAEYNMTKERYTIGRLPDNDVRIDNPALSGHHALIINILNDSFLEDLNSTNGTYVNSKLVKKHALQNDDVITMGHHQLKFVASSAEEDYAEFARTIVIENPPETLREKTPNTSGMDSDAYRQSGFDGSSKINQPDTGATHASDAHSLPTKASGVASAKAKIQILSGSMAGRDLTLNKTLTTLGRPGEQVIAITKRGKAHYIVQVDRKSGGGSAKVNGEQLAGPARQLADNDIIELMDIKMGFFAG
ncbi:MAG: FHA domain-containing protein [Gammaproteobacteria bacterium]|nr:FHA domain-containing protein [Gammaproteobacteria bacterium]